MILALAIGNDLIRIGILHNEKLTDTWSLTTPAALTVDEAEATIYSFLLTLAHRSGQEFNTLTRFDGAIIASVVPALTDTWIEACRKVCGSRPLVVGPGLKTGIRMNYNDPSELGADRIANIVAARSLLEPPFIVVDMGTTTNFSVMDAEGVFCGGIIAPGLRLSAEALSEKAALLATVGIKTPTNVIGKSTQEATRSGIVFGEAARSDGLIEAIWTELGYETTVIITGANAPEIAPHSKHVDRLEADLTLIGLSELYKKNRRA